MEAGKPRITVSVSRPEAGGDWAWNVTVGFKEFLQLEIGKLSGLRETVHAFAYFSVYKAIYDLVLQVV